MSAFSDCLASLMALQGGMSAYRLSNLSGVSQPEISRLLADKRRPSVASLNGLAGYFGEDLGAVLRWARLADVASELGLL